MLVMQNYTRRARLVPSLLLVALCTACGADRPDPANVAADAERGAGGESAAGAAAPSGPGQPAAPAAATDAGDGVVYTVDPASSEVYWKISKAGMMARFGHNHVISAEEFSGTVTVDPDDPAASRFELEIPVAELVIDDPELRARFGEDFESVPSEEDKTGTRRNMLSEDLLDGEQYPYVRVRGRGPEPSATTLPVEIEIVGQTFDFDLPGEVVVGDGHVEASGDFALEHEDLGLTPFSALGGALQVGPTIEFSYRIRAVPAD